MPSDTKAAPHIKINTGSLKGSPPTLSSLARKDNQEPETLTNCALCTAAALTKQTSDQVNDELKIALPQSAQAFATYARKNVLSGTKENNAVFDYVAHKDLPQTEWEKLTKRFWRVSKKFWQSMARTQTRLMIKSCAIRS